MPTVLGTLSCSKDVSHSIQLSDIFQIIQKQIKQQQYQSRTEIFEFRKMHSKNNQSGKKLRLPALSDINFAHGIEKQSSITQIEYFSHQECKRFVEYLHWPLGGAEPSTTCTEVTRSVVCLRGNSPGRGGGACVGGLSAYKKKRRTEKLDGIFRNHTSLTCITSLSCHPIHKSTKPERLHNPSLFPYCYHDAMFSKSIFA